MYIRTSTDVLVLRTGRTHITALTAKLKQSSIKDLYLSPISCLFLSLVAETAVSCS